jgi:hypothetical protein
MLQKFLTSWGSTALAQSQQQGTVQDRAAGDDRRLRTGGCWRQATCRCRIDDRHRQLSSRCRSTRDGIARRLQLPSKLVAQHKFGTRRRAMLGFEREPFPTPCHVDQDVAHSRAWCALRHLTTFDRVLSALHCRNHFPVPPGRYTQPMLPRGLRCGQQLSRPEYTSKPTVTFAPQHTALWARPLRAEQLRAGFRPRRTIKRPHHSWLPADPGPWQARAL